MSDFEAWVDTINSALDVMSKPVEYFTNPPAGGDPKSRLVALALLRDRLGLRDVERVPAKAAAEQLAEKFTNAYRREDLTDVFFKLAITIDGCLVSALEMLRPEDRADIGLIRAADFSAIRYLSGPLTEMSVFTGKPQPLVVCCAEVDSLAADHWVRNVLADGEWLVLDREFLPKRGLILGKSDALMDGNHRPRPFTKLDDARTWTSIFRRRQLDDIRQEQEAAALEERRRAEHFWQSPIGKELQKQEVIAKLKAAGKIPEHVGQVSYYGMEE
jgi:hypothetical protein